MDRILTIAALFLATWCHGQKDYAKEVIEMLCSEEFHGRGYVMNGDKVAAEYITDELKSFKVKPIGDGYYQDFTLDVNTFPASMTVKIDDNELEPGVDFIVNPASGRSYGNFELILLAGDSIDHILDQFEVEMQTIEKRLGSVAIGLDVYNDEDKSAVYQLAYEISQFMPVLIANNDKFTWGVSTENLGYPLIEVASDQLVDGSEVELRIEAKLIEDYQTQNIIGVLEGKDKNRRDEYVVFTAHYDHLGHMGADTYIPGANDNASGVAMLLSLAEYYKKNRPDHSVAFMFFGAEEAGILGSKHYVENPLFPLDQIKFLLNLDLLGTGEEGIQVVNSTVYEEEFNTLNSINDENGYLVNVKKRGAAANSDHHWFTEQGVHCFFIYTLGGISAYHDIHDKAETLPLTEFNDVFRLLTDFVATF